MVILQLYARRGQMLIQAGVFGVVPKKAHDVHSSAGLTHRYVVGLSISSHDYWGQETTWKLVEGLTNTYFPVLGFFGVVFFMGDGNDDVELK